MTNKQLINILGTEKALRNVLNSTIDKKGYAIDDEITKDFLEIITDTEMDKFFIYLDNNFNLTPLNSKIHSPMIITRKDYDPLAVFVDDIKDATVICSKKNKKQCINAINQWAFNIFKFDYTLQRDLDLVEMAYNKNNNIFNLLDTDIQNILRGDY